MTAFLNLISIENRSHWPNKSILIHIILHHWLHAIIIISSIEILFRDDTIGILEVFQQSSGFKKISKRDTS